MPINRLENRLEVTGVRLEGGEDHAHITYIFGPQFGQMEIAEAIRRIEALENTFYIGMPMLGRPIAVSVIRSNDPTTGSRAWLRARCNGVVLNNLLALPRK
ncbi:hypothetical protein BH09PSE5_BH09PSE5_02400 [soil metagenome]